MQRFLIRRLLQSVLLLVLLSVAFFLLIHALPGGPEQAFFSPRQTAAQKQAIIKELGLDQPLPVQYVKWVGAALHGDFGRSYDSNLLVLQDISTAIPNTVLLFVVALSFALVMAILLGVFSAVRQYSLADYLITVFAYFGISMPVFFFAEILQVLFGVQLQLLPVFGRSDPEFDGVTGIDAFIDLAKHLILPALVLSLLFIAAWSRYLRAGMLDVLKQDYIRTAKAKGLSSRVVFFRHGLRNALIPLITVVALAFGGIFGGAFVTESIFAWPGLGLRFLNAINGRDYPVLLALLMLASTGVVIFNLVADILYGVVDPRIRYA
ncbi:MAG TPA: ABC transporter permease [Ktedonobacterales bacterium]|nr:ABC transporter permease [Ktedonobacterales bacterium]